MKPVDRIVYTGTLPASFFIIPANIYKDLSFKPTEDVSVTTSLFEMEAKRNEIIIYTNHTDIRLAGIFPIDQIVAYFGFWETTDDIELCEQAFDMLTEDAQKRDRTTIIGPVDFNTYHNYRLRIGDVPSWNMFDREPVNPTYYPSILQQLGFAEKVTFESRLIRKKNIPEAYISKAALLQELNKIPFDFIPLNEDNWLLYEEQIFELAHAIFNENPFYKTISTKQFKLLYNPVFAKRLCPYSSVIFRDKASGRLAAISMCHPNYQTLYPLKSPPSFENDYQSLNKKMLLVKTVGVHPDFRKLGLMNYLGAYGMVSFKDWYEEVIFCLMRSDNYSLHFTDSLPYEVCKYSLYEKRLES